MLRYRRVIGACGLVALALGATGLIGVVGGDRSDAQSTVRSKLQVPAGPASIETCIFRLVNSGTRLQEAIKQCVPTADLTEPGAIIIRDAFKLHPGDNPQDAGKRVKELCVGQEVYSPIGAGKGGGAKPKPKPKPKAEKPICGKMGICVTMGDIEFYEDTTPVFEVTMEIDFSTLVDTPPKPEPKPSPKKAPAGSGCMDTIAAANGQLMQCEARGWKGGGCESVFAQIKGCPDPKLIYVDPEQGYACGQPVDAAEVSGWLDKACAISQPAGNDGRCTGVRLEQKGPFAAFDPKDVCSNPYAHVDPGAGLCVAALKLDTPKSKACSGTVLAALAKLGPMGIVIPLCGGNVPPPSGTDPRPVH